MAKLVYLDSSDFSNLSRPEHELSEESRLILSRLRQHKAAGTAAFFMSAIHLSEAVHAAKTYKELAVRRAKLISELCGSNILRFPIDLPRLELRKALTGEKETRLTPAELTSQKGDWFGFESSLDNLVELRKESTQKIDAMFKNLPRHERRKLKSELDIRKPSSRAKWRALLNDGAAKSTFPVPFGPSTREAAIAWFLREISDNELRRVVVEAMSDPYVLFVHVLDQTAHRETFYELLRKQGRDTARELEEMVAKQFPALAALARGSYEIDLTALINQLCARADVLCRFVVSYADISADHVKDADLPKIVAACPSLSAFIESSKARLVSFSAAHIARVRAGNFTIKEASPSDFGDLMHSFYAPYFDVFRCDARFGSMLKTQKALRPRVADRLSDILTMLPELPLRAGPPLSNVGRISA
jgi:hypothetical protein